MKDPAPSWKKVFQEEKLPGNVNAENMLELLDITAGGNSSKERDSPLWKDPVPQKVRDAAMKGVLLSYYYNYPSWRGIGLARGVQLATQKQVWEVSRNRMAAFFKRNQRYESLPGYGDDIHPSKSYMAYKIWGDISAKEWVL